MSAPQILIDFFKEMFNRLKSKSPRFFKVLKIFAASLTFAGYVPSMLQQWFNIEVSGEVIKQCEGIAKYATGALAMSFLPTDSKTVAITDEGSLLKVTNEKALPFTAKSEQKAEEKKPDILPEIPTEAIKQ